MVGPTWRHVELTGIQTSQPHILFNLLICGVTIAIGVLDNGKAVTTARNISLDTSYPKPDLIRTIKVGDNTAE